MTLSTPAPTDDRAPATRAPATRAPAQGAPEVPPHRGTPPVGAAPPAGPRPPWARPGLAALLAATAVLYLWGLGASAYANDFYAAAVQAGTRSWKAMFFGSLDAGNAITVDKPAFFLWPMEISGRVFGVNGWSLLVPQALEGVAAVALLAAAVRRVAGHAAGLAAGAMLALTPVAVLMFRFDNPDAMLTLLLTGAAYAAVRALDPATRRGQWWLALAGTLVGLGFITKMGQALLVVPALAITHLWAAPAGLGRRVRDVLGAGVAMVAAGGWWVAAVELWPASSRPYVGGSTTNSVLELAFGYNGLGRLFGGTGNGGGGGGQGASFAGSPGITRLFTSASGMATEISWLLPAALLALVAGLWLRRTAPRTDLARAALVLLGGWLLVTGLVFSFMQGTIHPYYSVALAPAIAGIVAVTGRLLWATRRTATSRAIGAATVEVTVLWDAHLLGLTPTFLPWLPAVLVAVGTAGAVALVASGRFRRLLAVGLVAALLSGAGGSAAYAVSTASQVHSGSMPSSGPAASRGMGGMGGMGGTGTGGTGMGGTGSGARTATPGGAPPSGSPAPGGTTTGGTTTGGGGDGAATSSALVALLRASTTRWAAATVGSQSAAPLQLASGAAVMAIGGFNGSDASPTLAQFEAYVAAGEIHYYVASGNGGGPGGGSSSGSAIAAWVASTFTATTVGGTTIYDLTQAASAG